MKKTSFTFYAVKALYTIVMITNIGLIIYREITMVDPLFKDSSLNRKERKQKKL
jgi:hypothetical protein